MKLPVHQMKLPVFFRYQIKTKGHRLVDIFSANITKKMSPVGIWINFSDLPEDSLSVAIRCLRILQIPNDFNEYRAVK